jgi:hypothetical protein
MSEQEPSTFRPFVFTVIEDDGVNVTIEVSEEDYKPTWAPGSMKKLLSNLDVTR